MPGGGAKLLEGCTRWEASSRSQCNGHDHCVGRRGTTTSEAATTTATLNLHLHHTHTHTHTHTPLFAMASKHVMALGKPLNTVLRASRTGTVSRNALRTFATTTSRPKELAADVSDLPNLRHAQRGPQGKLEHAPVINNADRTADRATEQHRYGQYLLSCLPKYIQQYAYPPVLNCRSSEHKLTHIAGSLSGRMS